MKRLAFSLLFLFIISFCKAQISYGNQVGKKDLKKETITFETYTATNGAVSYGFKMNDLIVGPNMVLHTDGRTSFVNYNKSHLMDGTFIELNKLQGTQELYTYRNGKKDGPAFKMASGKVSWTKQFKDDKIDPKGYQVNHDFDYYVRENVVTFDGFTIEKYKNKSYAVGYFAYGKRAYPIIHVWENGDNFMGQNIQNYRKEFGVYFYSNGTKYVGSWHQNNKQGLGFMVDKNNNVTEKGFYEDGKLVKSM